MNQYIISEEILKKVLAYLGSRPHSEVYQGIEVLKKLKKVPEEKTTTTPDLSTVQTQP